MPLFFFVTIELMIVRPRIPPAPEPRGGGGRFLCPPGTCPHTLEPLPLKKKAFYSFRGSLCRLSWRTDGEVEHRPLRDQGLIGSRILPISARVAAVCTLCYAAEGRMPPVVTDPEKKEAPESPTTRPF